VIRGGEIAFRKLGDGSRWLWEGTISCNATARSNITGGVLTGLANPVSGVRLTAPTGAFNGGGFYVEWGN
jgi:hypothetical protein